MSRYSPINLAQYPVPDILESLSFEAYLARDLQNFRARWADRVASDPTLPALDAIILESDPSRVVLEVGSYREMILRARVNDALRSLTLAGATGAALDHIGVTYYRTPRLTDEQDEAYRQRLALAPEAWSIAGPEGAYLYWALSSSQDIADVAVYSEDEGVCLAPQIRAVVLPKADATPDGWAPDALLAIVMAALRRADRRPMGDLVTVESAVPLPFDIRCDITVRPGVSAADVAAAARSRLAGWASGRTRWIGDDTIGPVWLIGRSFSEETLAAIARGGDGNILDVDVTVIGGTNAPHPDYQAALAGVGSREFQPLAVDLTAHLFRAPLVREITVEPTVARGGWFA